MMPHEDVNVTRFDFLVNPDHRMITTHLGVSVWRIGSFVNVCHNVNIGAGRLVVGVPFLLFHQERWANAFHQRMGSVFHNDGGGGKPWNVTSESNSTHELREPWPDTVSVKLTKQRRMMKPDPSPAAFLNVSSECRSGLGRPPIRRIVQLNKDAVLRQERVVDLAGILNVIDREIVIDRLLLQPFFGRIYKGPMN